MAFAARDNDLDADGIRHGVLRGRILFCCGPIDGLADRPRPQRWHLIGWNEHGFALVYRSRLFEFREEGR